MRFLILSALLLMTSCATTSFNSGSAGQAAPGVAAGPAMPPPPRIHLFHYSDAFQDQLLIESRVLLPPCDRSEPVLPCSAEARINLDTQFNRNQMRTLGVQESP